MAGHSKWANIKYRKEAADAKKGKLFSKLAKEITVAAREGGGDPEVNPRLRQAIEKAREANMPMDNVERAIKRGTGELPGVNYEHVVYEGYGPGGVAVLIEALTDNRNRTTSEIRNIFTKKGGNMAGAGSVSWIFHRKGLITVEKSACDEDTLLSIAIEAGADDMKVEGDRFEITTSPENFEQVREALKEKDIPIQNAEITMLPSNYIKLEGQVAKQILSLMDTLQSHDDVQQVYANFDIPDEIIEEMANEDSGN
ncbi:MAG: YebC/PmpR family DNA-binding transcriptional regulator [Candidatus Omnitrophica bacterium]|nr:YebC/PmpR family DNA-binding transcriptional regulator [Candidatus Omnitrophota bacterium]